MALRRVISGLALAGLLATAAESPAQAAAPRDLIGSAVAISGDTAVVGAPGVANDTGAAYVYQRSGQTWKKHATLNDPFDIQGDEYADAVAIDQAKSVTRIVIGDGADNVAYVYTGSGQTWRLRQTLKDPGSSSLDGFGSAIELSATTLAIGAAGTGYDFGAAYIYGWSGTRWKLQASLNDPAGKNLDLFGRSLAFLNTTVLIGAVGVTYSYTRTGAGWAEASQVANPGASDDNFGAAVAAVGTTVVIGAPGDPPGPFTLSPGVAYVYQLTGTTWSLEQTLPAPGAGDFFGYSAAMTGQRMAIGMPRYGSVACGAVFDYQSSGTAWVRSRRLGPPGCAGGDQFGSAVAAAGTTAVIGAPYENVDQGAFYIRDLP